MSRVRDSQRQRLYNAELNTFELGEKFTLQECQEYAEKIVRSKWWEKRDTRGVVMVEVKAGQGRRSACGSVRFYTAELRLPLFARNEWVILHELAHCMTKDSVASHGREFAKNYLALVDRWLGKEEGQRLRKAYKAHRVKYRVG